MKQLVRYVLTIKWYDGDATVYVVKSMKSAIETMEGLDRNYGDYVKCYNVHKVVID